MKVATRETMRAVLKVAPTADSKDSTRAALKAPWKAE
jgi:hypothetical protein